MLAENNTGKNEQYKDLYGIEIDHISNDGGDKYGRNFHIYFKNGKALHINAELDIDKYGIVAKLSRTVGSYGTLSQQ